MDLEKLRKAGECASRIKKEARNLVKENVSYKEVVEFIEGKIKEEGHFPAFPCTICVNEQAAHFTVYDEDYVFKKGDVVKVDFGASYDGWLSDNAFTVEVGTNNYKELLEANETGLKELLARMEIGESLGELGKFIGDYAEARGFSTIHNLTGHEMNRYELHGGLRVPNFDNKDSKKVFDNSFFGVEPFFTTGSCRVVDRGNSNILCLAANRNTRDRIAREVLKVIKERFASLNFSKRWLLEYLDKRKVDYGLKILKKEEIVYEYSILVSEDDSIISQFEETVVFCNGEKYITTQEK